MQAPAALHAVWAHGNQAATGQEGSKAALAQASFQLLPSQSTTGTLVFTGHFKTHFKGLNLRV